MRLIGCFGVEILVARPADIEMLSSFQGIVERDQLSKFGAASVTFPPAHASLKNHQRVFVFFDGVGYLVLGENPQIFENDDVVAAFQMSEEVRSTEDYSQAFEFGFAHLVDQVGNFLLAVVLLLHGLVGKSNDLGDFLLGYRPVEVEVLLDKAETIQMVGGFLLLQFGNQTVEFGNHIEESLLGVTNILECLLAVDAVVEVDMDERLSNGEVFRSVCVDAGFHFFAFQFTQVSGRDHVALVARQSQILVFRDFVAFETHLLLLLVIRELVLYFVKVELSGQIVQSFSFVLQIFDVFGCLLDNLIFA